jgi:hypothetical protein
MKGKYEPSFEPGADACETILCVKAFDVVIVWKKLEREHSQEYMSLSS